MPYYRDDSCFDDGTGTDPGAEAAPALGDEPRTTRRRRRSRASAGAAEDGDPPTARDRFYQGSIGTHGLHLLFLVDSDNARQTVPLTEIVVRAGGW